MEDFSRAIGATGTVILPSDFRTPMCRAPRFDEVLKSSFANYGRLSDRRFVACSWLST
jgi:aminoglycoside N3'-acetyltransferase